MNHLDINIKRLILDEVGSAGVYELTDARFSVALEEGIVELAICLNIFELNIDFLAGALVVLLLAVLTQGLVHFEINGSDV